MPMEPITPAQAAKERLAGAIQMVNGRLAAMLPHSDPVHVLYVELECIWGGDPDLFGRDLKLLAAMYSDVGWDVRFYSDNQVMTLGYPSLRAEDEE